MKFKKILILLLTLSLQSCNVVGTFSENISAMFSEILGPFFSIGFVFFVIYLMTDLKDWGKWAFGIILLGIFISIIKCSTNSLEAQQKIIQERYNSSDLPSDDLKKVYDYKIQLTKQKYFLDSKSTEIQNTINDFSDKLLASKKEFNLIKQNNNIYSYNEAINNNECIKLLEHIQRRYAYINKCNEIFNNAKSSSISIKNLLIKTEDDILLLQTLNENERERIIENLNTQIENFDENNFIINPDNLDVVPLENIFNQLKNE